MTHRQSTLVRNWITLQRTTLKSWQRLRFLLLYLGTRFSRVSIHGNHPPSSKFRRRFSASCIVSLSELEIRATLLLLLLFPMCVCTLFVYSSSRYYVRCARVEEAGKKFGERERERERNALLWYDITCYYDSDGSMKSMKWIGWKLFLAGTVRSRSRC